MPVVETIAATLLVAIVSIAIAATLSFRLIGPFVHRMVSFSIGVLLATAFLHLVPEAFESGARLPERVDAVMETVGAATFKHSIRALRPGGKLVISGATSGDAPPAELTRVFFLQLSVIGSTMGTRDELERLIRFCLERDIRPTQHATMALADARAGFEALAGGEVVGKIVFTT